MASYALLGQADEGKIQNKDIVSPESECSLYADSLHKSRLLNVEEKPFKRITKRLLTPNSLLSSPSAFFPTPPPDRSNADEEAIGQYEAERQRALEEWRQFREDVTLDF